MKQQQNKIAFSLVLLAIGCITACKKFVEVPPPTTQLVTASLFNNNASATSAVTAIYQQMYSNGESYSISQNNGLLSDELTGYSTQLPQIQYYTNAMTPIAAPGEWINAYNYIYQANAVIEALSNNNALSPTVVRQLTGEAQFIRAFWHFYLTNCFGDVPLVTATNYTVNANIARTPQAKVYQQVITDLISAQNLLNANYVDATDTTITTERVRPTKWAATALLAKAYLYHKDYSDAVKQATSVINNSTLYSLDTLNGVFLANSSEAIWQISTPLPADNNNTLDGYYYILLAAPGTGSFASTSLSVSLLNSFEKGDQRYTHWINSISFPGQTYYFPYKYKVSQSANITEYTMVLRLGEQYLIRAEAEANLGDANAVADLNIIRTRAGLANYNGATDKASLLTAIMHERQVELFTEWGNRWFDLVRTGNVNAVMGNPGNVCQAKGGAWKSTDNLYPIPQSERNVDANLTQNPGY